MYKSPQKPTRTRQKVVLPRISLPSCRQDMQLSIPKRSVTQSLSKNIPSVSAKAWIIYNQTYDKILSQFNSSLKKQMASLTKIMTAICTLCICKELNIVMEQTVFRITDTATNIGGTLANLPTYQWISIQDCLYGLMLPSGNDAALVLAENLGALLKFNREGQLSNILQINSLDLTDDGQNSDIYVQEFIGYMNKKAKQLGLKSTYFLNPHGLDSYGHFSTCEDILVLTTNLLADQMLSTIVNTKYYAGILSVYKNKDVTKSKIYWVNTNKLLGKNGCKGIKTGFTQKAGGCLSSLFEVGEEELLVIVLGCKSSNDRFNDTLKLVQWGAEQLEL